MKVSLENLGPNFTSVVVGDVTVFFSYKTPIAFYGSGHRVVRENSWGPTTGKHLNRVDGGNKAARVSGDEFERLLAEELG